MKRTLPGVRVALTLMALLGVSLVGCSSEDVAPTPAGGSVDVQFDVAVPASTPCSATVEVVGNDPALGGGKSPGLALKRDVDGHFRGSGTFTVGKVLTYNFVLTHPSAQEPIAFHSYMVENRRNIQRQWTVSKWSVAPDPEHLPTLFVVDVPASTPANSEIWLSGNQESLGNWNGAGVQLAQSYSSERSYVTCLEFSPGTNLEFKATRGSWDSVEKDAQGGEINNRFHRVDAPSTVAAQVGSWRDLVPEEPRPDTLTGNIKYHEVDGSAYGLKNRQLIVWLPSNYDTDTNAHYPVLYMHDGQNLMNVKTSAFGVEWGVDETAQQLVEAGQIEPIIIVGIYNTVDRVLEYTQMPSPPRDGGKADDYGRLLVETIKPLIDSTYRTKPEPEYTGLAGSSLGGLVSMYLGLTHGDTFTRLGVISPSVWWASRDIVSRVNALSDKKPLRIWLDIGTEELGSDADNQETVDDTRLLRDALIAKGWVLDGDLKYLEAEGGRHNEASWRARMDQILKYLYPAH
ncbi:putative esterase [Hyalangium minutum]|uniref:Putative esterase n=2 Tax=Hyalangium minutum TaxID=394096 RepID=A0A085WJ69_9BACT|nr:putative esterase [Hyalangium minutum]